MKKCVIIPTLNEESGIGKVIGSIPNGYCIYVVDGGSRDKTLYIAKKNGAHILKYPRKGKGYAFKEAIRKLDYDIYVLIDGDGSYEGSVIPELIKPIVNGEAELVLGSRFLRRKVEMSILRLVGNKIINWTYNILNNSNLSDIATGLRAMSNKLIKKINLKSDDFRIDVEITLTAHKGGYRIIEIPIPYFKRLGRSKLKISDMVKIFLYTIYASVMYKDGD